MFFPFLMKLKLSEYKRNKKKNILLLKYNSIYKFCIQKKYIKFLCLSNNLLYLTHCIHNNLLFLYYLKQIQMKKKKNQL